MEPFILIGKRAYGILENVTETEPNIRIGSELGSFGSVSDIIIEHNNYYCNLFKNLNQPGCIRLIS